MARMLCVDHPEVKSPQGFVAKNQGILKILTCSLLQSKEVCPNC